jgi:hypothetical protein
MRVGVGCVVFVAFSLYATGVQSGTPYKQQVTCPIGGEKFQHTFTASHSTFGSRPDGKPYGSWIFPMPIPVCPSNKLPMYSEFSKEQITQLEPLVRSADFREIAAANTPYFTAAWLMQRSGEKPESVAWMVVQASWEADGNPAQKRRYQEDYVARLIALPKGDDLHDWLFYQIRAANGLRELGRFDETVVLVDRLAPHAQSALEAAKRKASADTTKRDREVESADYLVTYLAKLRATAASLNPAPEPVAMLPLRQARYICQDRIAGLNPQDRADCAKLPSATDESN